MKRKTAIYAYCHTSPNTFKMEVFPTTKKAKKFIGDSSGTLVIIRTKIKKHTVRYIGGKHGITKRI